MTAKTISVSGKIIRRVFHDVMRNNSDLLKTKPRSPARIKRVMNALTRVWMQTPDMRLGQLLINIGIAKDNISTWHMEERKVLEMIGTYEKRCKK